jgi:hypothetical protein
VAANVSFLQERSAGRPNHASGGCRRNYFDCAGLVHADRRVRPDRDLGQLRTAAASAANPTAPDLSSPFGFVDDGGSLPASPGEINERNHMDYADLIFV